MAREDAFTVAGVMRLARPNGTFDVELPNGHRVLGHAARRHRTQAGRLQPGEKVILELSPGDLSRGRIKFGQT